MKEIFYSVVYYQCQRRGWVPIEVLVKNGVLPKQKYEERRGSLYLEQACTYNPPLAFDNYRIVG